MSNNPQYLTGNIKNKRLPKSLVGVILFLLLIASGVHSGFITLGEVYHFPVIARILVPIFYWISISVVLTIYIRKRIKKTYEEPLKELAVATHKVATGDFSIRVDTIHSSDKYDYLDSVILDFNKMVEELSGIEVMKSDFISNVSHEFKTPIAVIQNNAEYLISTDLKDNQKECVEAVYTSVKRLTSLVSNILRLSKLENQSLLPSVKKYDVCAQLAQCAVDAEEIIENDYVVLEADMEDRAYIKADPSLMELVWNNLLSNALKFTSVGAVSIKQYSDEENIFISIIDTGCGMDKYTVEHIFDKFYQGDSSHSIAGNGLGLTLVKRVLSLHGFEILVKSTKGNGSEFKVIMPKAQ